jgi:hypothetical protein
MENALDLPGSAPPAELPGAFGSMLHRGRISGSERILTHEFMGQASSVRIFAVRADCRGDTAWIFAAPELKASFGDSLMRMQRWRADTLKGDLQISSEFSELSPVRMRFSSAGMTGVEGCFDEKLTSEWLQIQSSGLKNLK